MSLTILLVALVSVAFAEERDACVFVDQDTESFIACSLETEKRTKDATEIRRRSAGMRRRDGPTYRAIMAKANATEEVERELQESYPKSLMYPWWVYNSGPFQTSAIKFDSDGWSTLQNDIFLNEDENGDADEHFELNDYGYSADCGTYLADSFVVKPPSSAVNAQNRVVYTVRLYFYVIGGGAPAISQLHLQILNAKPSVANAAVLADITVSHPVVTRTKIYRNSQLVPDNCARDIYFVDVDFNGAGKAGPRPLGPGTYWLKYGVLPGNQRAFGPQVFTPPTTALGYPTMSGNAGLQLQGDSWTNLLDGDYHQGLPFIINPSDCFTCSYDMLNWGHCTAELRPLLDGEFSAYEASTGYSSDDVIDGTSTLTCNNGYAAQSNAHCQVKMHAANPQSCNLTHCPTPEETEKVRSNDRSNKRHFAGSK